MLVCSKVDLNEAQNAEDTLFLLNTYATDIMGGGERLCDYTVEHLIAELLKRPTAHVFIARVDNKPAGLSICFERFSTFACKPLINIHDFCVCRQTSADKVWPRNASRPSRNLLARLVVAS